MASSLWLHSREGEGGLVADGCSLGVSVGLSMGEKMVPKDELEEVIEVRGRDLGFYDKGKGSPKQNQPPLSTPINIPRSSYKGIRQGRLNPLYTPEKMSPIPSMLKKEGLGF
jgi:hypothetical protein